MASELDLIKNSYDAIERRKKEAAQREHDEVMASLREVYGEKTLFAVYLVSGGERFMRAIVRNPEDVRSHLHTEIFHYVWDERKDEARELADNLVPSPTEPVSVTFPDKDGSRRSGKAYSVEPVTVEFLIEQINRKYQMKREEEERARRVGPLDD